MKNKDTKTQIDRHCYRLPPCPAYDVEGTESWLESMAADGWLLEKDGFTAGIARFVRREPQQIRYRLQAAPESTSMWTENGGVPDPEALALSEACGWEYLTNRGQFYIFACNDPSARELDTDPQVQALALGMVCRRQRSSLVTTILWLVVYPLLFLQDGPLRNILAMGTGLFLLGTLLVGWAIGSSLAQVIYLRGLRRRLAGGEPPDHQKDWRRRARRHHTAFLLFLALALCWGGLFAHRWYQESTEAFTDPLPEYTQALPFPTLQQLRPDGVLRWDDFGIGNTVKITSDWLAPTQISVLQAASLQLPDGRCLQGVLDVDYFETRWPWAARELAREMQRQDAHTYGRHFTLLTAPDLPVEQVTAYSALSPTLVLVEGNRVMRVSFSQTSGDYSLPMEEWGLLYARALKR